MASRRWYPLCTQKIKKNNSFLSSIQKKKQTPKSITKLIFRDTEKTFYIKIQIKTPTDQYTLKKKQKKTHVMSDFDILSTET